MTIDRLRAFDAVVFDMDGVLLDSEPLHLAALNRVIGCEGHRYSDEQSRRFVGSSLVDTWTAVHRELGLRESLDHYYQSYDKEVLYGLRAGPLDPLPGVQDLIDALRQAGRPLGLATQSPSAWVRATLAGLALSGSFAVVVTGDAVTKGKPDPEVYLRACALLDADPACSLAIEDSIPGARAGRAAGMTVVGVRNRHAGPALEREADVMVDRLDALLASDFTWPPHAHPSPLLAHNDGSYSRYGGAS